MKRLILSLFFIALSIAPLTAHAQLCPTPVPTSTPTPTYPQKVQATSSANLLAYWQLNETSGTTAYDSSGHGRNGTYSGVTLNASTFNDGSPVGSWDGINDFVNLYSSSLAGAFNGSQGTILSWAKVSGSGVWTDGSARAIFRFASSSTNDVYVRKSGSANSLSAVYVAGGATKVVNFTASSVDFFPVAITWDAAASQAKMYFNGAQVGTTQTSLGVWSGSLASNLVAVGGFTSTPAFPWSGYLAHVAVWDTPLTAGQIADLAIVPLPATATPTLSPTCAPTLTPSPTGTANIHVYWTLQPPVTTGTPAPGQTVSFTYEMTAGGATTSVLLGAIIMTLLVMFTFLMLRKPKAQPNNDKNLLS